MSDTPNETPQVTTLTISAWDALWIYFVLRQVYPQIKDMKSFHEFLRERFNECGWIMQECHHGSWTTNLVMKFVPGGRRRSFMHDWPIIIRVQPFLGFVYRAVRPDGRPAWLGLPREWRLMAFLGVGATGVLIYGSSYLVKGLKVADPVPVPQAPVPVTSVPAVDSSVSPGTPPSPAAAPASASGNTPQPTDSRGGQEAESGKSPAAPAATPVAAAAGQPKNSASGTSIGEPYRMVLPGYGAQSESSVARTLAELINKRPNAPVIYLEFDYNLGQTKMNERWWFNFHQDYVQNDSQDIKGGRIQRSSTRLLIGQVKKRIENVMSGARKDLKLSPEEKWVIGPGVTNAVLTRTLESVRSAGYGPELISKISIGKRPAEAILTVTSGWSSLPYDARLSKAKELWHLWWLSQFPIDKDYSFLILADGHGGRVGGSGVLGADVYVVK